MKLVALPTADSRQPAYINPHEVRVILPFGDRACRIMFSNDHFLVVSKPIDQVAKDIQKGM